MTLFEKLVAPLIEPSFNNLDFTSSSGFVDCYVSDPDHPSSNREFFVMYDARVRTEWSEDRYNRLAASDNLKRMYIKYIDSIPYQIYSFYVPASVYPLYKDKSPSIQQKLIVADFWGPFDKITEMLFSQPGWMYYTEHELPLGDYMPSIFDNSTIGVEKIKGTASDEVAPFLFGVILERIQLALNG